MTMNIFNPMYPRYLELLQQWQEEQEQQQAYLIRRDLYVGTESMDEAITMVGEQEVLAAIARYEARNAAEEYEEAPEGSLAPDASDNKDATGSASGEHTEEDADIRT